MIDFTLSEAMDDFSRAMNERYEGAGPEIAADAQALQAIALLIVTSHRAIAEMYNRLGISKAGQYDVADQAIGQLDYLPVGKEAWRVVCAEAKRLMGDA